MSKPKFLSLDGVQTLVSYFKDRLSEKVDIEPGKTLSDNNFSDEEKQKLAGIEADSQVNLIESISVNGNNQSITNKNVDIAVPLVDTTLTRIGQSADAKTTGDAISDLTQSTANDVANLQQSISSTAQTIRGEIADEVATINQTISDVENAIPTNVSELTNDSNYATTSQLTTQITNVRNDIPTNVSELVNDSDYTTKLYVNGEIASVEGDIPTNISQLNNDSNYTTKSYVDSEIDTVEAAIPTNVSQLTNDVKYQTENEVARSIANSVSQITSFDYQIINELPQTGKKGTIYLVLHTHGGEDKFDEYIWVNNRYEKLGHTDIDLSGYARTTDLPTKVSDLNNDSNFTTKTYVDGKLDTKQDVINYGTPTENDVGKALMPKVISNGEVTEWEFGESGSIDDVQVNGTSIVSNGVAEIPYASADTPGLIKTSPQYGLSVNSNTGLMSIIPPTPSQIKSGDQPYAPVTSNYQHQSVFYGLAKAAGDNTQSASSNAVGTYTDEAKSAIQTMLDVPSNDDVVTDVQANGTSVLNNGIANIGIGLNRLGLINIGSSDTCGLYMNDIDGRTVIHKASDAQVKAGTMRYRPIVPDNQHTSAFYGLTKAAGVDMASSNNPVGTYTDEAKSAIQSMLGVPASDIIAPQFDSTLNYSAGDYVISDGKLYKFTSSHSTGALDGSDTTEVILSEEFSGNITDVQIDESSILNNGVANIPIGAVGQLGVVQVTAGAGGGISVNPSGGLIIAKASSSDIKGGTGSYKPIVTGTQHEATFYGLAKAAGDSTQSSSNNQVGTYTDSAKSAIQTMLGIDDINFSDRVGKGTGTKALVTGDIGTNDASGNFSIANGADSIASGMFSFAEGSYSIAAGNASHAEGSYSHMTIILNGEAGSLTYTYDTSLNSYMVSVLQNGFIIVRQDINHFDPNDYVKLVSIDNDTHTITVDKTLSADSDIIDQTYYLIHTTYASGISSHAEGFGASATNAGSHSEGGCTLSLNVASHSEGYYTKASGQYSHSEGAYTNATGLASHAGGAQTTASGVCSVSFGQGTTAQGLCSHSEGDHTVATHRSQYVFGDYNIFETISSEHPVTQRGSYVEIVGNGDSSARSNARTLDWSGNEWLAGTLKIGGTSYANANEVATQSYVNSAITAIETITASQIDALFT